MQDFTKPSALRDAAGPIMEWAQEIFGNVKRKVHGIGDVAAVEGGGFCGDGNGLKSFILGLNDLFWRGMNES